MYLYNEYVFYIKNKFEYYISYKEFLTLLHINYGGVFNYLSLGTHCNSKQWDSFYNETNQTSEIFSLKCLLFILTHLFCLR